MSVGIILLVVLAVLILFQLIHLSVNQKNRSEDMVIRLTRIEEKLNS